MAKLIDLVLRHYNRYPLMQAEDFHKLLFQATRGPVHSLHHLEKAREYFFQEWGNTISTTSNTPLFEDISLHTPLYRVHFEPLKGQGVQPELVWEFFLETSKTFAENLSQYKFALQEFLKITKSPSLHWIEKDFMILWEEVKENSLCIPTHSEIYRSAYQPHYRIVSGDYLPEIIP